LILLGLSSPLVTNIVYYVKLCTDYQILY